MATSVFERVKAVQKGGKITPEEMLNFYDQDMVTLNYCGASLAAEHMDRLFPGEDRSLPVLDVGAGTGLVAISMKEKYGFTNIDGLDASQSMLDEAKKRNIYNKYLCTKVGGGIRTDIDDNSYTAVVMSGALAGGHIKCDVMEELIRIVKPGGIIVNVMREEYVRTIPEYTKLLPFCQDLEDQRRWKCLEQTIPDDKFYMEYDALVQVYQVL